MNKATDTSFTMILQNERLPQYYKLAVVFAILNALAFSLFLFTQNFWMRGITGLAVLLLYFLLRWVLIRKRQLRYWADDSVFFVLAPIWLFSNLLMAIFMLVLGMLFRLATKPLKFVFSQDGVYRSFFPKKTYVWSEFNNIILKDGWLTLDFTNNRVMQVKIHDPKIIDANAFNAFVQEQLAGKGSHAR